MACGPPWLLHRVVSAASDLMIGCVWSSFLRLSSVGHHESGYTPLDERSKAASRARAHQLRWTLCCDSPMNFLNPARPIHVWVWQLISEQVEADVNQTHCSFSHVACGSARALQLGTAVLCIKWVDFYRDMRWRVTMMNGGNPPILIGTVRMPTVVPFGNRLDVADHDVRSLVFGFCRTNHLFSCPRSPSTSPALILYPLIRPGRWCLSSFLEPPRDEITLGAFPPLAVLPEIIGSIPGRLPTWNF
ncbi:hypothetical protein AG1IA_03858 [Rhizoctonia solani AG-1 IA]|uniref:Uncharacterized protein n=1 Tax=Thanatephorus cucumeris (strain AG1-IA) TaxID=983506 RepID=L8WZ60_THACA|nr:hypothetical protein AG1IA_03858 [Rhizoctonia solani AG-1 IA]